jgi:ligand-binding sensor domain-containing protein
VTSDRTAQLWTANGELITDLQSDVAEFNSAAFSPDGRQIMTAGCGLASTLALDAPVMGMALDAAGNLWAATDGQGVLGLEGGRDVYDSRWQFFTASNSKLLSDKVRSITTDRSGNLWFGTTKGLVRFDGEEWEKADLSGTVTTMFEEAEGQLWVGTTEGGYSSPKSIVNA